ncbi:MAG: tRNA pseudouridine synthase A [Saprospiraceae bacterium]
MRYFFEIAFNGTNYCGWQRNINAHIPSIQEILENKLSLLLQRNITIWGCGRTDKGVHAEKYFAHIEIDYQLESSFLRKCNAILPLDIAILNIYSVPDELHARFNARSRTYRYRITLEKCPQKMTFQSYYNILNEKIPDMEEALHSLIRYDDFKTMCRTPDRNKHTFCTILNTHFEYFPDTKEIHMYITANRFLKSMMRMLVGYLVLLGKNKIGLEEFYDLLEGTSHYKFHQLAFPQGLSLVDVTYPRDIEMILI